MNVRTRRRKERIIHTTLRRLRRLVTGGDDPEPDASADALLSDERSAEYVHNPVIVIPGLLGTRLVATGTDTSVWGDFDARSSRSRAQTSSRDLVAIPMQFGTPLDQLERYSQPDGTLGVITSSVAGMSVKLKAYDDILMAMGVGSYTRAHGRRDRDASAAAFEFDYDWRLSLDEAAVRLHDFILQAQRFLQLKSGKYEPIRFDIVAHSMGGLVLRYYLQYGPRLVPHDGSPPTPDWRGADSVDTAVIVGTPNAGAVGAMATMVRGVPKNPLVPAYSAMTLGTMPGSYQLLPRARHAPFKRLDGSSLIDPLDPEFWLDMGWGLGALDTNPELMRHTAHLDTPQRRRDLAEDHLRKCATNARLFHEAMDAHVPRRPAHLRMHLFLGDSKDTERLGGGSRGDKTLRVLRRAPGDGSVLRSSALLDENVNDDLDGRVASPIRWDSVTLLNSPHRGLMGDPLFLKNLLFRLHAEPR